MRIRLVLIALLLSVAPAIAADLRAPENLPRYDLAIQLDVDGHQARVSQNVVWVNPSTQPVGQLIFNVHSHFSPPKNAKEVDQFARLIELFRLPFRESIYYANAFKLDKVEHLRKVGDKWERDELKTFWHEKVTTALVVPLPQPVPPGGSVAVSLSYTIELPQKQGRWGQWKGVTFLSNWHPILSYFDKEKGWQPTPFIPWHQPWFNEAGIFNAVVRMPKDQQVACTGTITKVEEEADAKVVHIGPVTAREFDIITSARFQEFVTEAENAGGNKVKVKCLAFPEHEHYAHSLLKHSSRAIENYSKWLGPYPYPELTIVETYFGWNGNELAGMIMIDERVFGMPHFADNYVQYLISHETCHQWFYNVVGTDGYRETFMDEAIVTYLSHRLLDQLEGKNNNLMTYPPELSWLPNIKRENYRYSQLYSTLKNDDLHPASQPLQDYGQVINLFAAVYDRGSKIIGMIEERLGPVAFTEFLRRIYSKYYFRVIKISDFQRELEEYTGRKWDAFFKEWITTNGLSDWAVDDVCVSNCGNDATPEKPFTAKVKLSQRAQIPEDTVVGFSFDGGCTYPVRVPVKVPRKTDTPPKKGGAERIAVRDQSGNPVDVIIRASAPVAGQGVSFKKDGEDEETKKPTTNAPDVRHIEIEVALPFEPNQVTIDPDQVLPDADPANNHWHSPINYRPRELYTFLDETNFTNDYDKWNVIYGPWAYGATYADGWYLRSTALGVRAGAFRSEEFRGGIYGAYRPYFGDIAIGADATLPHFPFPMSEVGFNIEKSVIKLGAEDEYRPDRAVIYHRQILQQTSSLYWLPREFVDTYVAYQSNWLPQPRQQLGERVNPLTTIGSRYYRESYVPYWNPEMGFKLDGNVALGLPLFGEEEVSALAWGQASMVTSPPEDLGWLSDVKFAARAFLGVGYPKNGRLYTLGGGLLFRGFDQRERQGSCMWIGSVEARLPICPHLDLDLLDRLVRIENIFVAPFYDIGDMYVDGRSLGPVAHAVGVGICFDLSFLRFLERATLRFDFAQAIGQDTNPQVWFNLNHPF